MVSNSEFLIKSLYAFASLTLSAATFKIPCLDVSPLELSINFRTLIAVPITDLSLFAVWGFEIPMEESNGSAFLPLLAVLESIGLKISLFLIRVEGQSRLRKLGFRNSL